jgi:hypothetical protein
LASAAEAVIAAVKAIMVVAINIFFIVSSFRSCWCVSVRLFCAASGAESIRTRKSTTPVLANVWLFLQRRDNAWLLRQGKTLNQLRLSRSPALLPQLASGGVGLSPGNFSDRFHPLQ